MITVYLTSMTDEIVSPYLESMHDCDHFFFSSSFLHAFSTGMMRMRPLFFLHQYTP
jgi:hypothetical protein